MGATTVGLSGKYSNIKSKEVGFGVKIGVLVRTIGYNAR
jgi:hypothetical protein